MSLTISDWLYEGILMDGGVLAVAPEYFTITGGRERWLYRVARKHAGGHGWPGFAIALPTLFEKSGAEGTYRRFKHEMKRIAEDNDLPEFALLWEERGGEEEPALRMVRRSTLLPTDPAYEAPLPRAYRHAALFLIGQRLRPFFPLQPPIRYPICRSCLAYWERPTLCPGAIDNRFAACPGRLWNGAAHPVETVGLSGTQTLGRSGTYRWPIGNGVFA